MTHVNLFDEELEYDEEDPAGYRSGYAHVTKALGASELNVKVMEIPPGESVCPYHYEYVEEWLVVLDGSVVLRTPHGEEQLERGAAVCFPIGPTGAHKAGNRGEIPARILMFSSAREPSVAVYPDSDKIGVWPGEDGDRVMLRRADGAVDYYDGER